MKIDIRPLVPIVLIALFAVGGTWVVGMLGRPVTAFHPRLTFLLGVFGWLHVSYGNLRQSKASYVTGTLFGFLALLSVLYPGLWMIWPDAILLSMAMVMWGAITAWLFSGERNFKLELSGLVAALGLTPVFAAENWNLLDGTNPWIAMAGAAAMAGAGVVLWKARQRFTIHGGLTWLFFIGFVVLLLVMTQTQWLEDLQFRRNFEEGLLFALIALGGVFMADLLNVEKQLRRGPHLQLDASLKDALTGLANRRALEMHGPQLIRQSHEASRPVSMIVADIDHFKAVNDTRGHLAGDAVLQKVARKLGSQVRKSDLVARYGGEEFIIILPGSPLAPALRLAERMRNAVEQEEVEYEGKTIKVTASFGVITAFPEDPMSLTQMIQQADTNLYRAKHSGRNRVMTEEVRVD